MPSVTIEVVPRDGTSSIAGQPLEAAMGERELKVFVLEGGMKGGAPSVSVAVRRDDGTWFVWETSARAFLGTAAAVSGVCARLGFTDCAYLAERPIAPAPVQ